MSNKSNMSDSYLTPTSQNTRNRFIEPYEHADSATPTISKRKDSLSKSTKSTKSISSMNNERYKSVPSIPPPLPPISHKVTEALNIAANSFVSPYESPSSFPDPTTAEIPNPNTKPPPSTPSSRKGSTKPSTDKIESLSPTNYDSSARRKRVVSDFHYGRTLGEGSYSTVVEVTEISTEKVYAAKILDKKHIIKEKKTKYLNGFPDDFARFYIAEIITAVEYMHSVNIIHRDLKPENILLGDDMHILITDFGSAKILNESNPPDSEIKRNSFVGTAEYVSPELLSDKDSGKSSDIWAIGCILFQLLAGKPPFKGANEYQTFQKVLKAEYAFPEWFSSDARDLITKLLQLDPEKRIGCQKSGFFDIKSHPFFNGFDWSSIYTMTPPNLLEMFSDSSSAEKINAISDDSFQDYPTGFVSYSSERSTSTEIPLDSQVYCPGRGDYNKNPGTNSNQDLADSGIFVKNNQTYYSRNKSESSANPRLNTKPSSSGSRVSSNNISEINSARKKPFIKKFSADEIYDLRIEDPISPLSKEEMAQQTNINMKSSKKSKFHHTHMDVLRNTDFSSNNFSSSTRRFANSDIIAYPANVSIGDMNGVSREYSHQSNDNLAIGHFPKQHPSNAGLKYGGPGINPQHAMYKRSIRTQRNHSNSRGSEFYDWFRSTFCFCC
ncbi:hypothetical protein BB560_005529 [Smittium megazygosporum]|uniref:non-specific serine/threonine protein kinase n=1 Tax=Smittium megazygosporum TaxID=133381 RepID=A0A2T9Z435_9FUNG|nr:hypothetical protein BB560_005529 [Smittium megazygosporum]